MNDITADEVEIYIDEDIKALHRPHTEEEAAELRAEVEQMGRFPGTLMCWYDGKNRTLIDGHQRMRLWCSLPEGTSIVPPTIEDVSLPDKNSAILWVLRHQHARRNSSPQELSLIRGRLYNANKPEQGRPKKPVTVTGFSADEVAKETGVSEKTVRTDGKYAEAIEAIRAVNDKAASQIVSGDLQIAKHDTIKLGALEPVDIAKCLLNLRMGADLFQGTAAGEDGSTEAGGQDAQKDSSPPGRRGMARNDREGSKERTPAEEFKIQRSKTIKTAEALVRAFDDLNSLRESSDHKTVVSTCQSMILKARNWPN